MNKSTIGALIAALGLTGACASNEEASLRNPAPCPNIVALKDAARVIEFDGEQNIENIAYSGEIVNVSLACRYIGDEPIDVEVEIDFALGKGPKGADDEKTFSYFVAVTRTDVEMIDKQQFDLVAQFNDDRNVVISREQIDRIIIPRSSENVAGVNFEIVVGFALTPQQAIYNRSGKSLKFPNIQ